MKNILFSSTCQWNPGDEFILRGVLNVLRASGLKFNPLIYNRNPVVNPKRMRAVPKGFFSKKHPEAELRENSFDPENPAPVDYVVFAGTPEWSGGPRVEPLLRFIKTHKLRCSFIGVGLSEAVSPSDLLRSILAENTDIFTCRDQLTLDCFSTFINAQLITCPSILSSKHDKLRGTPKKIGCGIQGTRMLWQSISRKDQDVLYGCYERLAGKYNVEYIAHYIDDLNYIPQRDRAVHYSAISADYYSIYDEYDLIISPRLHGCGIAASLGIPSICLAHDKRGAAAQFFGAVVINSPEEVDSAISKYDWESVSKRILNIKTKTADQYQTAIQPLLAKC